MKQLPDIQKDFSQWYNEVIYQAELVDHAPVRGCMVIRPYGYAIWERIQQILDARLKETGHQNASFPLLIPESFLTKEAEHVAGFAPELAVVTHAGGKKLEEPLVIRPTSETIIHHMFAQWIRSWRDLPLKINQWCSVVRWEMRPRPFLRTTEFFWQEGHTAHETKDEAYQEVLMMLDEYVALAQNYLAIPVFAGTKTDQEKFPGAEKTLTFEAFMPDGKALQMGTSHLLSQSFAHAFNMQFQNQQGTQSYPYLTSWGVTTRLIGGLIMAHGDQKGLVLPPNIAPIQVVIVPIFKSGISSDEIITKARNIQSALISKSIRVHIDEDQDKTPGAKFFKWELKGVPLRIEIGPKDLEKEQVMIADRLGIEKKAVSFNDITITVESLLTHIQDALFKKALQKRNELHKYAESFSEIVSGIKEGYFYQTAWCKNQQCEQQLKEHQATIRCIINDNVQKACFYCNQQGVCEVLVGRSY